MAYLNGKRIGINAHVICDTDASYTAGHTKGYTEGQKAGYGEGQRAMAVMGNAKGNPAVLDYVHPAEHELAVRLESPAMTDFSGVAVTMLGKNWLDIDGENADDWWNNGREFKRGTYVVGISRTLAAQDSITAYSVDNNTVKITSRGSYYGIGFPRKLKPNTQYVFSAKVSDPTCVTVAYCICDNDGNMVTAEGSWHDNKIKFTTNATGNVMLVLAPTEANREATFTDVLLELGDTVTEYEPYKGEQTVTANADGTVEGLMSAPKTATLTADNSGVTIHAAYWLDAGRKLGDMGVTFLNLGGSL